MSEAPCEVWFYHLERTGLDQALPELLEKTLQRGWKAIVRSAVPERLEHLDGWLWSYRDDSFLPHGLDREANAAHQPVLESLQTGSMSCLACHRVAHDMAKVEASSFWQAH